MAHLFIVSGVVAGPFFITAALLEGLLRVGYQPLRQPVSALAIGSRGWIQRANFFVTGALALVYAFGLPAALQKYGGSFWAPALIALYGLGLLGSGLYTTDVTG